MPWSQTPPSPMAASTLSTLGREGDQGPPPEAPQAHQHHHHAGLLGQKLRGEEELHVVGRGRREGDPTPDLLPQNTEGELQGHRRESSLDLPSGKIGEDHS